MFGDSQLAPGPNKKQKVKEKSESLVSSNGGGSRLGRDEQGDPSTTVPASLKVT